MDAQLANNPAPARRNASKVTPQHRISAKVRTAIDAMVWQGLKRDEAAKAAGMQDNSLYVALRKADVKAYYLSEIEVLRTSERARNIHRLVEIRDAADNMPAVQAIDRLMQAPDTVNGGSAGVSASPGITIRIINQVPSQPVVDVSAMREVHSLQTSHEPSD